MKPVIRNPVINNPWAPNMPNNFRGSHAATVRVTEPAHLNIKPKRRRVSKTLGKAQIIKNFTDQLVPLYPFLSKAQVKAAVALANCNFHQSRLLLDVANKFLKIPHLNIALNVTTQIVHEESNSPAEKSTTDDSFSTGTGTSNNSSASDSNWLKKKLGCDSKAKLNGSSFTTTDTSTSSVYDFSESEYNSEPIQSWSSQKKQITKKRKIGVSIVKNQKGYKAFLL